MESERLSQVVSGWKSRAALAELDDARRVPITSSPPACSPPGKPRNCSKAAIAASSSASIACSITSAPGA